MEANINDVYCEAIKLKQTYNGDYLVDILNILKKIDESVFRISIEPSYMYSIKAAIERRNKPVLIAEVKNVSYEQKVRFPSSIAKMIADMCIDKLLEDLPYMDRKVRMMNL